MTKLTEIMRQKIYQPFTELLSRFKTGIQTDEHICCNQPIGQQLPIRCSVDQHNNARLAMIPKPIFTLPQINILTMSIIKILTEYWQEEDLKLVDLIMNFI